MTERHVSVVMAQQTILNLRKLITALRSGKTVPPVEIEVMISRAILDLAGISDYAEALESQLGKTDDKDRGIQSLG